MSVVASPPHASLSQSTPTAHAPTGLGRDLAWVGGSTAITHALGVVTSLLLRAALEPAMMGIWQTLRLFLGYGNYLSLGASKAAARKLSVARGRGTSATIESELNVAHTLNSLTSLGYAAVLLAVGGAEWLCGSGPWRVTWAALWCLLALWVLLHRALTFRISLLRAERRFDLVSQQAIVESALTLVLCGSAAWFWGLSGLACATLVVVAVSLVWLRGQSRPLGWAWDRSTARSLVASGAPILACGAVTTLFRSVDRLMLLAWCDDREFLSGCYSIALLVTGQLYGLGNMTATVLAPRLAETFGRTNCSRSVTRWALAHGQQPSASLVILASLSLVAAPAVLGTLLPAYGPGLMAMRWGVVGAVAAALALVPFQALIACGRERAALAGLMFGTLAALLLGGAALLCDKGLAGLAAAMSLAQLVYWGASWCQLTHHSGVSFTRVLGDQLARFAPPLLVAMVVETVWPTSVLRDWRDVQLVLAKLAVVGCVGWLVWRAARNSPREDI